MTTKVHFCFRLTMLFCAIGFVVSSSVAQQSNSSFLKFRTAIRLVNAYYVDSTENDVLVEQAIKGMLRVLDPHSVYLDAEEAREADDNLQGNFEGIGINYNLFKDTILVVSVIPGGPSEKVGVKAGDRIVKIDNIDVANVEITNTKIKELLRGERGSQVTLHIKNARERRVVNYQVTRDRVPINSLDAAFMVNDFIGYIKLNRFSMTTMKEFSKALALLKDLGMESLILDLRDNGGGYLHTAVDLADEFINESKLVLFTKGVNYPRQDYYATSKGEFENGNLVVLIDEGSASASEIVAGAIQDWDRGLVIGRRSFGKGLVQRPFSLNDGSKIRLTTARYFTPTGRLIQKPYSHDFRSYRNDLANRLVHGELCNADSIQLCDSLVFKTLANRRAVYGGGGIMPDIFVPLDTTFFPSAYKKMLQAGLIHNFVVYFVDKHRVKLRKAYEVFDDFEEVFQITNSTMFEFKRYIQSTQLDVKIKQEAVSESLLWDAEFDDVMSKSEQLRNHVFVHLKALIAANIWSDREYYIIYSKLDSAFQKATEVLHSQKLYFEVLAGKID